VKAHLTKLQQLREDLIAIGAEIADEDFIAIIMGSLPLSYDPYLVAMSAATTYTRITLNPETYLRDQQQS
jgi:hypothetical protein